MAEHKAFLSGLGKEALAVRGSSSQGSDHAGGGQGFPPDLCASSMERLRDIWKDIGRIPAETKGLPRFLRSLLCTLVTQKVKNLPATWRSRFDPWVGKIPWRRQWLPTPVFLPGEFHGQRSPAGYGLWGHKESDTTEQPTRTFHCTCISCSHCLPTFQILVLRLGPALSSLHFHIHYAHLLTIYSLICLSVRSSFTHVTLLVELG